MSLTTTLTTYKSLKATLNSVFGDEVEKAKKKLVWPKYLETDSMSDNYDDDLEMGGPGLLTEKAEGQDINVGSIREGYLTRYLARTFAMRLIVSEEALEDSKYPQVINAAKRLVYSAMKTQDYDAANILNRAVTSGYTGGDGVVLASASHTLPTGGTYSNTLSTAFAPSRVALQLVRQAVAKLPSPSGLIEGYKLEKIVCPVEQTEDWKIILGSSHVPESANNAINPVASYGLELVEVPFWTSTSNWAALTDATDGGKWKWRRKLRDKSWMDEDAEIMKYKISYRSARGWSNPRWFYFSNA